MRTVDWIILILNIACLVGSIIGAFNALNSYKKCKQLTNFANLKVALDECQQIFSNCRKLLICCGKNLKSMRGINFEKEISDCGIAIKESFSKIKDILPSNAQKEVNNMLLAKIPNLNTDIEGYVSLLISGHAYKNGDVTENYISQIEKTVNSIHLLIKERMEEVQEREKKL